MQPVLRMYARSNGTARVPTSTVRSEPALAAGITAALSHAAELDPIHAATIVCPACVTIPAALTVAQLSKVSGHRYISSVCGGYEVAIRVGRAIDGASLLAAGWWPTAVVGSMASAASAAICMGLESEQLLDAIGLAAVHSGGLAIGGPSTAVARNLLCAQTVRIGVEAAFAARSGVEGPREVFSGSRNFLTAFSNRNDASPLTTGFGERWSILETSLKNWPCALQAQSALAALSGMLQHRPDTTSVESIEITLPAAMHRIVDRPGVPASRWAAAASLQFLAAALLIDGEILDSRMSSVAGRSEPRIVELMRRIHVLVDTTLDARYPQEWPASVRLRDARGEATAECSVPPGHPRRPLSFAASDARFRRHAAGRLPSDRIEDAITFLKSLEAQPDVARLIELLRAQPEPPAP